MPEEAIKRSEDRHDRERSEDRADVSRERQSDHANLMAQRVEDRADFRALAEKLDRINDKVTEGFALMKSYQGQTQLLCEEINGRPGDRDSPGLKVRVARLEESRKTVLVAVAWTSTVCAAVATVVGVIVTWMSR